LISDLVQNILDFAMRGDVKDLKQAFADPSVYRS